ncbi:hypothetical protein FRC12_017356, partial [Ceratobasidium sp. 428]
FNVLATSGPTLSALSVRQNTQLPKIPTECKASCEAISEFVACGPKLSCMCTDALGQGFVDCSNCSVKYQANSTSLDQYKIQFQASIDSLTTACTSSGYPIGPYSILNPNSSFSPSASAKSLSAVTSIRASGAFALLTIVVMVLLS